VDSSYSHSQQPPDSSSLAAAFGELPGGLFPVLEPDALRRTVQEHGAHFGELWTFSVTLWAFLSQCLFGDKSCTAAVARVIALFAGCGEPPSANNGAFCKARAKIPVALLERLTTDVGQSLSDQAPPQWLYKGRHVKLVDGTTVSGPDTAANQEQYPQSKTQKKGLGFPLIRLVVVMCLATAVVVDAKCSPYAGKGMGEPNLLRQMFDSLHTGDILLGDRYYCSWVMIAALQQRGVDVCFRHHQRRKSIAKTGTRLGEGDYVGTWDRPKAKPEWMSEEQFAALPAEIRIREVHFRVAVPGFRVRDVIVVTTLLDHELHSREEIAGLYRQRWHVELNLRSIKTRMKMDILSGKTPAMLRREVWGHLLTYNLVRRLMMCAAVEKKCSPLELSFTGAMNQLQAGYVSRSMSKECDRESEVKALVKAVGQNRVGRRPNRYEPRGTKRRKNTHKLLTKPRNEARRELLAKSLAAPVAPVPGESPGTE